MGLHLGIAAKSTLTNFLTPFLVKSDAKGALLKVNDFVEPGHWQTWAWCRQRVKIRSKICKIDVRRRECVFFSLSFSLNDRHVFFSFSLQSIDRSFHGVWFRASRKQNTSSRNALATSYTASPKPLSMHALSMSCFWVNACLLVLLQSNKDVKNFFGKNLSNSSFDSMTEQSLARQNLFVFDVAFTVSFDACLVFYVGTIKQAKKKNRMITCSGLQIRKVGHHAKERAKDKTGARKVDERGRRKVSRTSNFTYTFYILHRLKLLFTSSLLLDNRTKITGQI